MIYSYMNSLIEKDVLLLVVHRCHKPIKNSTRVHL